MKRWYYSGKDILPSREQYPTLSRSFLSELIITGAPAEMVAVQIHFTHYCHHHHPQHLASMHCVESFSTKLAGPASLPLSFTLISLSKLHKIPSPHIISCLIIPSLMCSKVNEDEQEGWRNGTSQTRIYSGSIHTFLCFIFWFIWE